MSVVSTRASARGLAPARATTSRAFGPSESHSDVDYIDGKKRSADSPVRARNTSEAYVTWVVQKLDPITHQASFLTLNRGLHILSHPQVLLKSREGFVCKRL